MCCRKNYILFFQTRQPIFVQLLQAAFRVAQCPWLSTSQKFNVENCIRTLSDVGMTFFLYLFVVYLINNIITAKGRGIAIPLDLESQVTAMFNKTSILSRQSSKRPQLSKTPKIERTQSHVSTY